MEYRRGHDYSLEIANLPDAPPEVLQEAEAAPAPSPKPARKAGKRRRGEPVLFDLEEAATEAD